MKKILIALAGIALLATGCAKEDRYIEQKPYRVIEDYTPHSFQIPGVSGSLTPVEDYDWITYNGGTFTVRRNTSGLIRRAEFNIAGSSDKAIVNQKAHSLDASLSPSLVGQGIGMAEIDMDLSTKFIDDYASWGVIYSKNNDRASGKQVPQTGAPVLGTNHGTITGLEEDTDYFIWVYVVSTEGDLMYSNPIGLVPPVYVKAGEDLQAAIDSAKEFSEIRVQGGAVFAGTILIDDKNKNKKISGGWNDSFTEQSWDNLSVIDGGGKGRCMYFANDATSSEALGGYSEVSYFELRNGFTATGHGGGFKVIGGPVTIHHCWIHNCEADRGGAFSCIEDDNSSEFTVYDCVITANVANGHGGAFSVEDGKARTNPNKAVIVGNIIANNRSIKNDGYAGSIYIYQSVDVQFVNNTVINSLNYYENNGNWWPSFQMRGNTCAIIANNLILKNYTATLGGDATLETKPIQFDGNKVTFVQNFVEGTENNNDGNARITDEIYFPLGFDAKTLLKNPETRMVPFADLQNKEAAFAYNKLTDFIGENYMAVGQSIGSGTLGTYNYSSSDTEKAGVVFTSEIQALLEKIGTDINGNPFIKNGKVDMGAIQSK